MREIKVTFQPSGRSVYVLPGTLLLEAAGRAGIILQTPCGGQGTCGKCKVRLVGDQPTAIDGTAGLNETRVKEGYRLACQAHVTANLVVEIPQESMFEATEQIDLVTGCEQALASAMNPQVSYGDDVIARIARVRENHGSLAELQQVVLKAINALIHTLTEKAAVPTRQIYEIVVAGNSTMQQILCGLDPSALGEVPFLQVFDAPLTVPAATLGLSVNSAAELFVFPQIGGFVGGDTVAGVLAAGMDKAETPTLLVDIGTNGEIVLAHNGILQATSTAAGPAFEGARIVQGMRATAGAIEKVIIRDDVSLNIIGNARPVGLCGTALIDAVAELLHHGLIDEMGRIVSADESPHGVSEALRGRLVEIDGHTNFLLVAGDESASGEPIYLWQKDVRELQLATGAIRAGINILLRRAGLGAEDLGAVLLAGAFGNFIRRSNARRIGLLPQIACDRIRFIGNAASLGAKLALLSDDERKRASELAQRMEHVDLSLDSEFQMEFGMAMMFPTNDVDACLDEGGVGSGHAEEHP